MAKLAVINGAAIRINRIYVSAKGAMVSVLPRSITKGLSTSIQQPATSAPNISAAKKAVDATLEACSPFLAPSRRAMMLPAPLPNKKPTACKTAIKPNTIPTAPLAELPS